MITEDELKEQIAALLEDPGFYEQHPIDAANTIFQRFKPFVQQVANEKVAECKEQMRQLAEYNSYEDEMVIYPHSVRKIMLPFQKENNGHN